MDAVESCGVGALSDCASWAGLRSATAALLDPGEVVQPDGDVGVVGAVGGFGEGQGPFGQRAGRGRVAELLQDRRRGCSARWRPGVVGAVGGFGEGQRPFGQRAGRGRVAEVSQRWRGCSARVATWGWSGP